MSIISTVANYGGKQPSYTQNIKQFVVYCYINFCCLLGSKLYIFFKIINNKFLKKTCFNRVKK